eukprot:764017-Hanusia_phi.AAC.3
MSAVRDIGQLMSRWYAGFSDGGWNQESSPVVEGWDKGLVKEIVSSQWKEFVHQVTLRQEEGGREGEEGGAERRQAHRRRDLRTLVPTLQAAGAQVRSGKYARVGGGRREDKHGGRELKPGQAAEYFDDKYPGEVIFAKMDGTTNEAEDINVSQCTTLLHAQLFQVGGFPTVLAFPKGWTQQPLDLSEKMRGLKDIVRTVIFPASVPLLLLALLFLFPAAAAPFSPLVFPSCSPPSLPPAQPAPAPFPRLRLCCSPEPQKRGTQGQSGPTRPRQDTALIPAHDRTLT